MKKIFVVICSVALLFNMSFAVEGTNKTIKLNKTISDEISERGEIDYFNFTLSRPGSLQIEFDYDIDFSYTVKLVEIDTNKTLQSTNFNSNVNTVSGRDEKSTNKLRLPDGDYQIQVSCGNFSEDSEEYEFVVNYDEEKSDSYEKESNNTPKTAMIIDYDEEVIGNLESTSDVDYYMVEIPYNGEVYTELEFDRDASYNVEMFYEINNQLKSLKSKKYEAKLNQSSDNYCDTSEVVRVAEGNYYFKVSKANNYSNEDYSFTVRYTSNSRGNYELESNDEAKNATEITAGTEFCGNLNSNSDVDYYKLSVWNANRLTVKMNVPDGAAYNVTTFREVNGELSQVKSETFSSKELNNFVTGTEQEISVGDYYFKVTSRTYSNSDYTFSVVTGTSYSTYNNGQKTTIVLEINKPYMTVNGKNVAIDGNRGTTPVIVNSRTLLPIRAVVENLGGTVTWFENESGINISLGGNTVYLTLNSALAYVNGVANWLDVAPTSINGRTMVPVKFVMDSLGGDVIWNATTGTVTINY